MQIDLMICISRSFLNLISSDILGQRLFVWEADISRAKSSTSDTHYVEVK